MTEVPDHLTDTALKERLRDTTARPGRLRQAQYLLNVPPEARLSISYEAQYQMNCTGCRYSDGLHSAVQIYESGADFTSPAAVQHDPRAQVRKA
jgi:hypothetical protein